MIGNVKESGRLYFFENGTESRRHIQNTCFKSIFIASDSQIMLQHFKLGDSKFHYLKYLFSKFLSKIKIHLYLSMNFVNKLNIIEHLFYYNLIKFLNSSP